MIDNVILILKMALTHPSLSLKELEEICNPLGSIPDPIMRSIASFENSPKGFQDLFHVVLVELPVGEYFCRYFDDQTENHMLHVWLESGFDVGREAGAVSVGGEFDRDDRARCEEAVSRGLLLLDAADRRIYWRSNGQFTEIEGRCSGD